MAEVTLESLEQDIGYLKDALHELLRRVPGVVAVTVPAEQEPTVEYWPSSIPGQKIPKITGNISLDFTAAMMGGVKPNTPQRQAELEAADAIWANREFAGVYHAGEIDDAAAGFLYAYSLSQPGTALSNRLYYESGLIAGTSGAIAQLKARGQAALAGRIESEVVATYPDSEFKRDVLAVTV